MKNQAKVGNGNSAATVAGRVRVDKKTKQLARRLKPGDIAVVDHEDLDETAARSLVRAGVRAVVNGSLFLSGRFPTSGPGILLTEGVALIEAPSLPVMSYSEGDELLFDGSFLYRNGDLFGEAALLSRPELEARLEDSRQNMNGELARFVGNTLAWAESEKDLILSPLQVPPLRTSFSGRQVLVVVRGQDHARDLSTVRSYIREVRPVLVGVDGGADALLSVGLKPDLIVGDMDSVSDESLRSGAELLVHAYADGRSPGLDRIHRMGLEAQVVPAPGTSEDVALLLAFERGAELIVAVGTHISMVEFLEKGRPGMASTLLTRIKVGSILVDAKGVSRLYQGRLKWGHVLALTLTGLFTMVLIFLSAPSTQDLGRIIWIKLRYTFGL